LNSLHGAHHLIKNGPELEIKYRLTGWVLATVGIFFGVGIIYFSKRD